MERQSLCVDDWAEQDTLLARHVDESPLARVREGSESWRISVACWVCRRARLTSPTHIRSVLYVALLLVLSAVGYVVFLRHVRAEMRLRALDRLEALAIDECRYLFPSQPPYVPSPPARLLAASDGVTATRASFSASLRVLVVNGHGGVSNELRYVLSEVALLTDTRVDVTFDVGYDEYIIPQDSADGWYAAHRHHCEGPARYDVIIIGDTIPLSRPYLQAGCPSVAIVLYVSNRYDYALHNDSVFQQLIAAAVRRPNVRVLQNNLAEQWYATHFSSMDLHVFDYIPQTGGISPIQCDMYVESQHELPPANDSTIYILNKLHAPRSLIQPLLAIGVELTVLPGKYGGQIALANRIIVHSPYQTNTMTLFEALRVNVTFLIPALPLFRSWMDAGLATIGDKGPNEQFLTAADITELEMAQVVDWWRPELAPLMYHFDTLEDLREGSHFRQRVMREAPQHRLYLQHYMEEHTHNVTQQWVGLLSSVLQDR